MEPPPTGEVNPIEQRALIGIPLITIWENIREVLLVAPEPDLQDDIRRRTREAVADLDARVIHTRMWKVGRVFCVMIHVVLPETTPCRCVGDLDDLRRAILDKLAGIHRGPTIDVVVTADAAYAAGGEPQVLPGRQPI
jgi:predicted Co/Zn/Cd cation transporter (cation efflux family)